MPPKASPLQLLEQGHVLAAEGLVFSHYMERGMQLEQDLTQAKQSFEAAQRSRAFGSDGSHLAVDVPLTARKSSRVSRSPTDAPLPDP